MLFPHPSDVSLTNEHSGLFWTVLTAIGGIVGGAVGAYLSKRAELHAIHEKLGEAISEAKLTREATKAIEGKIDQYYWHRQRIWEVKRDCYIEIAKKLGALRLDLGNMTAAVFNLQLSIELKEEQDKKEKEKEAAAAPPEPKKKEDVLERKEKEDVPEFDAVKASSLAVVKEQEELRTSFGEFIVARTMAMLVAPHEILEAFKEINNLIADKAKEGILKIPDMMAADGLNKNLQIVSQKIEELTKKLYEDLEKSERPPTV